jgi:hypothetical protein
VDVADDAKLELTNWKYNLSTSICIFVHFKITDELAKIG